MWVRVWSWEGFGVKLLGLWLRLILCSTTPRAKQATEGWIVSEEYRIYRI
jgi:hypothetical protein